MLEFGKNETEIQATLLRFAVTFGAAGMLLWGDSECSAAMHRGATFRREKHTQTTAFEHYLRLYKYCGRPI